MLRFDHTRRTFCRIAGICGCGALLGVVGCGCGDGQREEAAAKTASNAAGNTATTDPCADLSGLSDDQIALRGTFGYVDHSDDPDLVCRTCEFYHPPRAGATCGGCQLFAGPVHPDGFCDSYSEA